ncbi:MAG TPA: alpha-L-rhamnosidase C-terminal domain-containing protein, partial [Streptosporangiaceae bacterium]|nr:alpha-L-rhamnosidase C-terminal domain-containing protein [Streptosporangiaceae bacterium]
EPGYRSFAVRPRPGGGITSATTRHISPFGPIDVAWRLRAGTLELDLQVPPGTTAMVILPGETPQDVCPGRHHLAAASPAVS